MILWGHSSLFLHFISVCGPCRPSNSSHDFLRDLLKENFQPFSVINKHNKPALRWIFLNVHQLLFALERNEHFIFMIQETVYIIHLFYLKEANVYAILYERKQVCLHGRRSFSVAGRGWMLVPYWSIDFAKKLRGSVVCSLQLRQGSSETVVTWTSAQLDGTDTVSFMRSTWYSDNLMVY